jgi:hypothetical protein
MMATIVFMSRSQDRVTSHRQVTGGRYAIHRFADSVLQPAQVWFSPSGKRGFRHDSKRVAACFLNDCVFDLGVNETMAAFGALQHPAGHWRRTHAVTANEPDAPNRKVAPKQASHNTQHPVGAMCTVHSRRNGRPADRKSETTREVRTRGK